MAFTPGCSLEMDRNSLKDIQKSERDSIGPDNNRVFQLLTYQQKNSQPLSWTKQSNEQSSLPERDSGIKSTN